MGNRLFETNTDPRKAPVMLSAPRGDTLVNKQKMHSAQMKLLLTSVLDAPLDSKPMAGNMIRNSSDLAVPQKDQTGRPMEGVTSPAPLRRSVTQLHLDSQPSGYQSMPDRPRCPVSEDIPNRQAKPPGNRTVPDVVVQNNTPGRKVCFYDNQTVSYGNKDNAVQTAPSELADVRKPVQTIYTGAGRICRKEEVGGEVTIREVLAD